jgi:hypothetical protein
MDHLVLDDALAAPITTPACRTHRPFLDMDDADHHVIIIVRHRTTTCRPRHRAANSLHLATLSSTSHGVRRAALDRQKIHQNKRKAHGPEILYY